MLKRVNFFPLGKMGHNNAKDLRLVSVGCSMFSLKSGSGWGSPGRSEGQTFIAIVTEAGTENT